MNRRRALLPLAALALIILASCGSSGILGGNDNTDSRTIHGTVDSVDLNSNSIILMNTSGYNSSLTTGGTNGSTVRVYFDPNVPVTYQGQNYRPQDLERGDEVDVRVTQSGSRLVADSMIVTYNANPNNNGGVYASSSITGTVRYVDTRNRTIEVDRGYGSNVIVDYDSSTSVMFNGRSYLPGDLEPGDQVTISTRNATSGRQIAQNIDVTRSMNSSSGSQYATIRGTVRSIDTYNHTIQLESASYISGFLPGNRSSVIVLQYDPSAQINVNGSLQPVSGLERGDMIEVQARDLGNSKWLASSFTLVQNVRR